MNSMTETDPRAEYIAGLRALADHLEATPELPLPTARTIEWAAHWFIRDGRSTKQVVAEIVRALPGRIDKNDPARGDYDSKYFRLTGAFHGLPIEVWAERDLVCRKVSTGTREVTKVIPAPDAPMVEVTETVEDFEWVCEPLLAEVTS